MPRFTEWVAKQRSVPQEAPKGSAPAGSQRFLVDNSLLRSDSTGLRYRTAEDEKIREQKPVAWGKCVWGVLNEAGTRLAVGKGGRRFLPAELSECKSISSKHV